MGSEVPFHQTRMGRTVIERDIPRLVAALQEIGSELKALNANLRKEPERGRERQD